MSDRPQEIEPPTLAYRTPRPRASREPTRFDRFCARWSLLTIGLAWFAIFLFQVPGRIDAENAGLIRVAGIVQLLGLIAASWCVAVARHRTWHVAVLLLSVLTLVACVFQPMLNRN